MFSLQNTATLNAVAIQTDNGAGDVYTPNRWATQIEILASLDGVSYTSVAKIQRQKRVEGALTYYRLAEDIQANYIKLVIHAPYTTNQAWRQLVEFKALYYSICASGKPSTHLAGSVERSTGDLYAGANYPNPFNPPSPSDSILGRTVQM